MGLFNRLAGATGEGIGNAARGIGEAAVNVRAAITGDLPPEAQTQLREAEARLAAATIELNKLDAQSTRWFQAMWRPALAWVCVTAIFLQVLVRAVWQWILAYTGSDVVLPPLETGEVVVLLGYLLGYGWARSFEKRHGVQGGRPR